MLSSKIPDNVNSAADRFYLQKISIVGTEGYADALLRAMNTCPADCNKADCYQGRVPEACEAFRIKIEELVSQA